MGTFCRKYCGQMTDSDPSGEDANYVDPTHVCDGRSFEELFEENELLRENIATLAINMGTKELVASKKKAGVDNAK